jgi:hypothetical protein
MIFMARPILRTDVQGVGWAHRPESEKGNAIDFRGARVQVDTAKTYNHSAFGDLGIVRQTVYNLEVDAFHTCFVSEAGVWTHDTRCAPAKSTVDGPHNHGLRSG